MTLLLALAALLASGLTACGSGDSSDSTGASTPTTEESTATTPGESTTPPEHGGSGEQRPGDEQGNSASKGDGGTGLSPDEGSHDFITPGGDNSIQTYGEEAGSSELEEAGAALAAYLDNRADGDWDAMCVDLSKATVQPLEQLAARAPQFKGKGCASILEALTGEAPPATRVSTLTGPVASLRVEGDRGFALYHGPEGVDYFMPMVKEDGKWKVAAIAPSEFPG